MTNWLPHEEAAQLRLEFETEIRRLEAAWIFDEAGRKRQRQEQVSLMSAKQGFQIPCSREEHTLFPEEQGIRMQRIGIMNGI